MANITYLQPAMNISQYLSTRILSVTLNGEM